MRRRRENANEIPMLCLCLCRSRLTSIAITGAGEAPVTAAEQCVPNSPASTPTTPVQSDLDRFQSAASRDHAAISRLRIEKWKTDRIRSGKRNRMPIRLQRNLTSALPGLIDAVRSAPSDLNADFRLYRNVNAFYDVMTSLTESAGAFGPKSDYEALAQQLETIDSVRRNMADAIEQLTASTQAEITRLQQQVRIAQQAAGGSSSRKNRCR